ncbi:Calx-beta domain-containing protein [Desulfuromonas thiophila]|uniref:Hemolysin-type calcium-binding repeat-containing protein n=1 Tax=Desulfuromonas thiophila TaxID=57664 RepID=A0A1G7BV35_9BACT|nr:Calx-beta domain-containing protein [Desulfuromonas thiophila]SDE30873.1 Hemolysin-type calcium-binding repeat-containing protein [Desulfuromonas thiophila]
MSLTTSQISQLYVALFNRASEGEGNAFWQAVSADRAEIADAMLATEAAKAYFGGSLDSNQAFIEHIYQNTLNKTLADDPTGIAFWVAALDGGQSRGAVVASLIDAVYQYAQSSDPLARAAYAQFTNRVALSDYTALAIEQAPADYARSLAFDQGLPVTAAADSLTDAVAALQQVAGFELPLAYTVGDAVLNEANGSVTLTVTRTGRLDVASTLEYSTRSYTAGPTDFVSQSGTLQFAPGQSVKNISIGVVNDTIPEMDEVFRVRFSSPSDDFVADFTAEVTILDNDGIGLPGGGIDTGDGLVINVSDPEPVLEGDAAAGSAVVVVDVMAQTSTISVNQGELAYVDGSLEVAVVAGSADNVSLDTLTIDAVDGTLTYNPDDFAFLAEGEQAVFDVAFVIAGDSQQVEGSFQIVITGENDAPVVNETLRGVADEMVSIDQIGNGTFSTEPDFSGWTVDTTTLDLPDTWNSTAVIDRTGTNVITEDEAVAVLQFDGYLAGGNYCGTAYGPTITSDAFTGQTGDIVRFVYELSSGGDKAVGTGYIRDAVSGDIVQTVFNYQNPFTGSTGVQTVELQLEQAGEFVLDFRIGSQDGTCGGYVGATMNLGSAGIVRSYVRVDSAAQFDKQQFLSAVSDVDNGASVDVTLLSAVSELGAALTLDETGNILYDPVSPLVFLAEGATAQDQFGIRFTDEWGTATDTVVVVDLLGVNDAPEAVADVIYTNNVGSFNLAASLLTVNDSDPDQGDSLEVTAVQNVTGGTAVLDTDTGLIAIDGAETFEYSVTDTFGGTDSAPVAVVYQAGSSVTGSEQDDILLGSAGNDTLTGGAGDDLFGFFVGCGQDTITDFVAGAATDDAIDLSAFAALTSLVEVLALASQEGDDTLIDLGSGDAIRLQGVVLENLQADDFVFAAA